MLVSAVVPVEPPAIVRSSAVVVVPIAPPLLSLMPPLAEDKVTPLPPADTIAEIVDTAEPVAVRLIASLAVMLWLMANDAPDSVNAAVDMAPDIDIAPASVTLTDCDEPPNSFKTIAFPPLSRLIAPVPAPLRADTLLELDVVSSALPPARVMVKPLKAVIAA